MIKKYSELRKSTARVDLCEAIPLDSPFTIYLEPTSICNFKCIYCPVSDEGFYNRYGRHTLNKKEFLRICQEIKTLGRLKTLNLYMIGEPFINKEFIDFIKFAKQLVIADRIIVTTNGSLLYKIDVDNLIDSGLDYLRVSIYGGFDQTQNKRTNTKDSLYLIRESLAKLKERKKERKKITPYIYAKMIDTHDCKENNAFISLFADCCDEVNIEQEMFWNNLVDIDSIGYNPDFVKNTKQVCPFPFYTLVIYADLKVSVCCVDYKKELVIGDLKKQSLASIWNGEKLHQLRKIHLIGNRTKISACKDCTYLYLSPDNLDKLSLQEYEKKTTRRI